MTPRQFAALLGFLFTAAWIGFGFGEAILCLVGAGVSPACSTQAKASSAATSTSANSKPA